LLLLSFKHNVGIRRQSIDRQGNISKQNFQRQAFLAKLSTAIFQHAQQPKAKLFAQTQNGDPFPNRRFVFFYWLLT
jgi:hypothetical protein